MKLNNWTNFYLVGIKGVAMTAMAECLLDLGKKVRGSDVAESFVTETQLRALQIKIDQGFADELPNETQCVIYTAAHQADQNPQVQAAIKQNIPVLSHAEALGEIFNEYQGIAVSGVGGKSTTSAMIAWILSQCKKHPAYAVGVGTIIGLSRTGAVPEDAEFFVAEADEYVTDPAAPQKGEEITPRFHFLKPLVTVCTNLRFDHPDVYKDFDHTKKVFFEFFHQIKPGGTLIYNQADQELFSKWKGEATPLTFGTTPHADLSIDLKTLKFQPGETEAVIKNKKGEEWTLKLGLPGAFNLENALAAILAVQAVGVPIDQAVEALQDFNSTLRRCQDLGEVRGVQYYDDYAHHPHEVAKVIHAFKEWYPDQKLVVAFQSHTYSRTKALFDEFVESFAEAEEVAMIDIFASAREAADESVSSDLLCEAIAKKFPKIPAVNYHTLLKLAEHLRALPPGTVCLTLGAGDIYKVHEMINS